MMWWWRLKLRLCGYHQFYQDRLFYKLEDVTFALEEANQYIKESGIRTGKAVRLQNKYNRWWLEIWVKPLKEKDK